ncbi:unnamed protein product [Paramecium sonneborni]|uniref:Transmembrane protein n=1 Tax=Paramecium sonneborni TaxID=65129 RepID=A0A8S1L7U5_9CILI|nr:unnamed protein product [Paramecium sonneborni]
MFGFQYVQYIKKKILFNLSFLKIYVDQLVQLYFLSLEQVEEIQHIIQKEQNKDQKQMNNAVWSQQICMIVFQAIYGLLFYLFSTTPGYYGDESSCIYLRKYSYYLGVATLLLVTLHFLFLLYSCFQNKVDFLLSAEGCLNAIYGIFSFVIWIMLWVALGKGEECGSLNTLVWVFTILIILGIFMSCCLLFCGVVISASQK